MLMLYQIRKRLHLDFMRTGRRHSDRILRRNLNQPYFLYARYVRNLVRGEWGMMRFCDHRRRIQHSGSSLREWKQALRFPFRVVRIR